MSEEKKPNLDAKTQMLEALAKNRKVTTKGQSAGPSSGSKLGAGQRGNAAPKMHRRKSGSA